MYTDKFAKSRIDIKVSGNEIYLEKKGIIQDKTCKNCKRLILKEKDFCECGFFRKAERNSIFWSSIIFPLIFIGFFWLFGAINFSNIEKMTIEKVEKHNIDLSSLSPVNVQMMTNLKNTSFNDYIQNIYIKQGQKNKLQVLIKPIYWDLLTTKEKKDLLKLVKINWEIIYKETYPNSVLKPNVEFANPD